MPANQHPGHKPLAWGRSVSREFRNELRRIADLLAVEPDWLMACMAFESGRTFSPGVLNAAGSGAVGLIQFMPSTAAALGTTTAALSRMSAVGQLEYVLRYFLPREGRLRNLGDVYMAILWPVAVGKPDTYVLFDRADAKYPKRYVQNAGLDFNRDGRITRGEACARVTAMLADGQKPENAA